METWLFIFGYLIQMVGSYMLLNKIWKKKSIYGLSSDTQVCLFVSTLSRVVWVKDTRLMEVRNNIWLLLIAVGRMTVLGGTFVNTTVTL